MGGILSARVTHLRTPDDAPHVLGRRPVIVFRRPMRPLSAAGALLAAAVLAPAFLPAHAAPAKLHVGTGVREALAATGGRVRVLVGRQETGAGSSTRPAGFEVVRSLSNGRILAGWLSPAGLAGLERDERTGAVVLDRVVHPAGQVGVAQIGADRLLAAGITGAGRTIAIVDTGIDLFHPDFSANASGGSRIVGGWNFADGNADVYDCDGHGTSVAGVAAGSQGIAPQASIVALKVFGARDGCKGALASDVLAAVDWALERREELGIDVLNVSLADDRVRAGFCDSEDPVSARLFARARAEGLAVVAASGNSGQIASLSWPACHSDVVSVGMVYSAGEGPNSWDGADGVQRPRHGTRRHSLHQQRRSGAVDPRARRPVGRTDGRGRPAHVVLRNVGSRSGRRRVAPSFATGCALFRPRPFRRLPPSHGRSGDQQPDRDDDTPCRRRRRVRVRVPFHRSLRARRGVRNGPRSGRLPRSDHCPRRESLLPVRRALARAPPSRRPDGAAHGPRRDHRSPSRRPGSGGDRLSRGDRPNRRERRAPVPLRGPARGGNVVPPPRGRGRSGREPADELGPRHRAGGPLPTTPSEPPARLLPTITRNAGIFGSFFTTDLVLFNPDDRASADVTLSFLPVRPVPRHRGDREPLPAAALHTSPRRRRRQRVPHDGIRSGTRLGAAGRRRGQPDRNDESRWRLLRTPRARRRPRRRHRRARSFGVARPHLSAPGARG